MPNIGPMELIVVLVIALVVLGPKRLPAAGKSLGEGIRGFKDSLSGRSESAVEELTDEDSPRQPARQLVTQTVDVRARPGEHRQPHRPAAEGHQQHGDGQITQREADPRDRPLVVAAATVMRLTL